MADERTNSVTVEITWDDARALLERRALPAPRFYTWLGQRWSWRWDVTVAGMMLAGTIFLLALYPNLHALTVTLKTLVPMFAFIAILGRTPVWRYFMRFAARKGDIERMPDDFHDLVGRMDVSTNGYGVSVTTASAFSSWSWRVIEIELTSDVLYFHYDLTRAVIVPARAFTSQEAFDQFASAAADAARNSVAGAESVLPSQRLSAEAYVSPIFDLLDQDIANAYLADVRWRFPVWTIPFLVLSFIPTIGMGYAALMGDWRGWVAFPVFLLSDSCFLFGGYVLERRRKRIAARTVVDLAPHPETLQQVSLAIDARGISEQTEVSVMRVDWRAIRKCDLAATSTVFHTGNGILMLPRRVFDSDDAYLDFVEQAVEFRRQALAAA